MEVRIERVPAQRVAARHHQGPYEGLADVVDSLVKALRKQKGAGGAVTTVFADEKSLQAGIPDAPADTGACELPEGGPPQHETQGEPIQARVWIPTGEPAPQDDAQEGLVIEEIPAIEAACVTTTGNPLQLPHMAIALRRFLQEKGYLLAEETWIVHLMPDWENPTDWMAEVRVPLRKTEEGSRPSST